MKKLFIVLLTLISLVNIVSFDTYAKELDSDEYETIEISVMYHLSVNGKYDTYHYEKVKYPKELGILYKQASNEYNAMLNGGVDEQTIDNYQIMKYSDRLIELNEKYPGWINTDALGL